MLTAAIVLLLNAAAATAIVARHCAVDIDADDDDLFIPRSNVTVDWTYSEPLNTLDLTNRGITALAPGAFDCYTIDNTTSRVTASGTESRPTTYRAGVVKGILLDSNNLTRVRLSVRHLNDDVFPLAIAAIAPPV